MGVALMVVGRMLWLNWGGGCGETDVGCVEEVGWLKNGWDLGMIWFGGLVFEMILLITWYGFMILFLGS